MGSRTCARQRCVLFMTTLLATALFCFVISDIALAQEAAPPACGGKVLERCTPNSGDTAWMLTSVALVLMMTIPGLGLFYGGMVRKKNVGDTVMTSFAVTCLVTILFVLLTYSMAFRGGTPFVGGLDRMFLKDILSDIGKGGIGTPNPLAPTIPEAVYICFQMTFAIITPALIAGAFAERMKFSAMLWFIGLWAIFVYAPVAHWVWGPDGFFASGNDAARVKVLDFAGGTVVHINAGVAGLMAIESVTMMRLIAGCCRFSTARPASTGWVATTVMSSSAPARSNSSAATRTVPPVPMMSSTRIGRLPRTSPMTAPILTEVGSLRRLCRMARGNSSRPAKVSARLAPPMSGEMTTALSRCICLR